MIYSIGMYILDTEKDHLLVKASNEIVSNHTRTVQMLGILADAYPRIVGKNQLIEKLWQNDEVSDWALSRQISLTRQLLATHDPKTPYIKTVHAQGFKLEVEPQVIEPGSVLEIDSKDVQRPPLKYKKTISISLIAFLILLGIYWHSKFEEPVIPFGEISPAKIIELPISSNWTSSKTGAITITGDGIQVAPMGPEPLYVLTSVPGSGFYQGAVFSMKMQLTKEFLNNKGWLRFYYQSTWDGWPGEWDCMVEPDENLNAEYQCRIDENGTFTKVTDKESVNFGVKLHQESPVGGVTITSAKVTVPASISTDKGWYATDGLTVEYDRGVSFQPKTLAAKMITRIKGPVDISGSTISFTVEVDDAYTGSDTGIQFYLLNNNKNWNDCYTEGENIGSNVFTKKCKFNKVKDPFILKQNESVDIGVGPVGKKIKGKISLIGITIGD